MGVAGVVLFGIKVFKREISDATRHVEPEQSAELFTRRGSVFKVAKSEEIIHSEPIQCWVELTVLGRFLISFISVEFKHALPLQTNFVIGLSFVVWMSVSFKHVEPTHNVVEFNCRVVFLSAWNSWIEIFEVRMSLIVSWSSKGWVYLDELEISSCEIVFRDCLYCYFIPGIFIERECTFIPWKSVAFRHIPSRQIRPEMRISWESGAQSWAIVCDTKMVAIRIERTRFPGMLSVFNAAYETAYVILNR